MGYPLKLEPPHPICFLSLPIQLASMYSPLLEKALQTAGIKIGDPLRYERAGQVLEGLLMPRPDIGDADCLVLKLKNGYNVGVEMTGAKLSKGAGRRQDFLGAVPLGSRVYMPPKTQAPDRPPIFLLSTGGTIASRVDYVTGAVQPQINADEFILANPKLAAHAPIKTRALLSLLSEDILPSHWTMIAQGVADDIADGADGIVIAHGTDTLGYTAAALSFALEELPVSVVLTGAQRSPDRGSSDAATNLFASAAAARADFAGVAVCMHADSSDKINHLHLGTRVRKSHTSTRGAFRSIGVQPIGQVDAATGAVTITDAQMPKREKKRKLILRSNFSSNVHLAWLYPGITPKAVASWADYDGVLLAGTGLGHAPVWATEPASKHSILPALKELNQSGVVLAMASQTFGGRVNMDVYSSGRLLAQAGVLGQGCDWLVETAYVKLCWALGQEKDKKKVGALLLTPRCRDILPRSNVEQAMPWLED